jgi:hypothetical protein
MPIDASIPLQSNPPQQQSGVLDMASKAFTLKSAMMQSQQVEQQQKDQQLLKQVLSDPSGFDIDQQSGVPIPKPETMQKLYGVSPTAAQKLGESTMKMKADQQRQQQQRQQMAKAYADEAGPVLATLATEYEKAPGTPEEKWAAIQPKMQAANEQFAQKAQQYGLPFKPIENAEQLQTKASSWSKYAEQQMRATQPQTPHERVQETNQGRVAAAAERRATAAESKAAGEEDKKLGQDELSFMARQALRGDTSVFQNIGRGSQGSQNIRALRKEIQAEGIAPEQLAAINAEFQGLKAGERTLGTRTANIEMAVTEAQNMAPLALAASEKVDRTKFPTLNAALLAAEKGTGGEDVVRLGVATNSLINIYSRAISPTGVPTVSDKDHARELLSAAWSKGQYKAGVDQLMQEMAAARKSPGQVRQSFREAVTGAEGGAAGRPDNPASGPSGGKRWVFDPATGKLKPSDGQTGATDPSKAVPE